MVIILATAGFYHIPEIVDKFKKKQLHIFSKKFLTLFAVTAYVYGFFIFQTVTRYKDVIAILKK